MAVEILFEMMVGDESMTIDRQILERIFGNANVRNEVIRIDSSQWLNLAREHTLPQDLKQRAFTILLARTRSESTVSVLPRDLIPMFVGFALRDRLIDRDTADPNLQPFGRFNQVEKPTVHLTAVSNVVVLPMAKAQTWQFRAFVTPFGRRTAQVFFFARLPSTEENHAEWQELLEVIEVNPRGGR